MQQKFYICEHCGNIVAMVRDGGVPVKCCGETMQEIIPGTTEASQEKHIPVWKVEGNQVRVTVGEVEHPMTACRRNWAASIENWNPTANLRLVLPCVRAMRWRRSMPSVTCTAFGGRKAGR